MWGDEITGVVINHIMAQQTAMPYSSHMGSRLLHSYTRLTFNTEFDDF